jgi:hypothetical protein
MRRAQDVQSSGQLLYEFLAMEDRSNRHWCEWRDVAAAVRVEWEDADKKIIAEHQQHQEEHEES